MRILIVGGTVFVGRALTDVALARGHAVTLLNRGRTAAALPAGVEHLAADRNVSLDCVRGRAWDAVIDTCAYYPRQVEALLGVLEGAPHYTLNSSISAYADHGRAGLDETCPLSAPLFGEDGPTAATNYGPLKSACEQRAREAAGARSLIVRPGIIVGPHDPTGRFGYWMRRLAGDRDFVAPGDGSDPLQVIDVRDLAGWTICLVEAKVADVFNAVGPREPLTFREFLHVGRKALAAAATPTWVKPEVLEAQREAGKIKLPLWLSRSDPRAGGMFTVDGRKAWGAGLALRPLAESIVDSSCYEATAEKPVLIGATPAEEQAFLQGLKVPPAE
jgi:2'-hydroxyisoflavone reductase